jgi:3-dehydrosphinganine reductase
MDFRGKHVIITGGSSGIGRAVARLLAQRGAHVSIIARRQQNLDETLSGLEALCQDSGQCLQCYSADVTDWEQVQGAMAQVTANDHAPDILINAAGFVHPGYFEQLPVDIFHQNMDVNYFGTLHSIKAVLPMMMERRRGHIVNFSSIAGFLGTFGYTAYGASKFAVRGLSDALRVEMKPYGISISVVFPPNTDTPQLHYENRFKPEEAHRIEGVVKLYKADQVAEVVVRGIVRRRAYILPGLDTKVIWWITNGLNSRPNLLHRFLLDRPVARVRREREAEQAGN